MANAITVRGIQYPSLTAVCKEFNIKTDLVKYRLNNGWTLEEAFTESPRNKPKTINIGGIEFKSMNQAYKHFKTTHCTVGYRLKVGWSLEESFGLITRKAETKITIKDKNFTSLNKACKYFNKSRKTIAYRLSMGWTLEEAFELINKQMKDACTGKLYVVFNDVNDKYYIGVTTRCVKSRLKQHKYNAKMGSKTKFHTALREIGYNNFHIVTLKRTHSRKKLRNLEIDYINKFNSIADGYNTVFAGGCLGNKLGIRLKYKNKKFDSIRELSHNSGLSIYSIRKEIKSLNSSIKVLK